jgi:hypothetical protein
MRTYSSGSSRVSRRPKMGENAHAVVSLHPSMNALGVGVEAAQIPEVIAHLQQWSGSPEGYPWVAVMGM